MATLGTGAQSTRKRVLAVQMALKGAALDEIAEAASLTPRRTLQVLAQVAEHGAPALYPTFVESIDTDDDPANDGLWAMLHPVISKHPREAGCLLPIWTSATLLDYLIYRGMVEDSNVARIKHTILSRNYWRDLERTFSEFEPVLARTSSLSLAVFFGVAGVLFVAVQGWVSGFYFDLLGGAFIFQCCTILYRLYGERKFRRTVVTPRNLATPSVLSETESPLAPSATQRFAPELIFRHANTLAVPPWGIDELTPTRNALGLEPTPVLYLWVFKAHLEQFVYETHGWPQIGPVHFLLNSSALTSGDLRKLNKVLIRDYQTLQERIGEYKDAPGTYERPGWFLESHDHKAHYRGYPIHTLVCTDSVWQDAFHAFAGRSRLAVFNLSGFQPGHPGLDYELRHMLSGGPPQQYVFLYDRVSDADGAIDSVLDLWARLPPDVRPDKLVFLRYQDAQLIGYAKQFGEVSFSTRWETKDYSGLEGPYRPVAGAVVEFMRSLANSERR